MTAQLRTVTMEAMTEAELLSTDLVADRKDPIFESALRAAAVFLDAARAVEPRRSPELAGAEDR
jgi:hypothetical protein